MLAFVLALAAGIVLVALLRPGTAGPAGPIGSNRPIDSSWPVSSHASHGQAMVAVGDIGSCASEADEAVADLASHTTGTIALLGDNVYERGTAAEYKACFEPAWGPLLDRFRPSPGNHDYLTSDASGYFGWFGAAAGAPGQGWYSYEVGTWHIVVLNSNCSFVGGCDAGSPQLTWLEADLRAHPSACVLAYWHHPRYSSGRHGSTTAMEPSWAALAAAGVDVILAGHDHTYERVLVDGVREFVVGTGGRSHYPFTKDPLPTTEVRDDQDFGLLRLALGEGWYEWQFVPVGSSTFADSGSGDCG